MKNVDFRRTSECREEAKEKRIRCEILGQKQRMVIISMRKIKAETSNKLDEELN